ncbi:MAG: hypothetical protein DWQ01_05385 [Planctomycetota bacterium]|nr:MAG: hypothetical protein DWQ01_05385 [Planctomycetota bacterium]
MDTPPRISEAEWQVMEVVWEHHPIPAGGVVSRLAESKQWSPQTIKTLLARLVKKGALSFTQEGKRYWYSPQVSRSRCIQAESQSFMARVFRGKSSPLLAHFVKEAELSAEEISELKALLERKEKNS